MRFARRDHRKAILGFGNDAIENHRSRRIDHLHDRIIELGRIRAANAHPAIGFREFHEIGQRVRVALCIASAMQQFLPLPHHAHILIVENENLDRQTILHRRRHFLHVHQDRRLARNIDHQRLRIGHLRADRRRQPVAHRTQTARRHPAIGLLEPEILRRPHLVLPHFRRDIGVAVLGQRIEPLNRILRLDDAVGAAIGEAILRPPRADLVPPRANLGPVRLRQHGLPLRQHIAQHIAAITHNADFRLHILVDRRRINIDMDFLRVRRKRIQPPRNPVIKPRADADHHIAIMHRHIGFIGAMHPQHTHPLRISRRIGTQPHQGRCDRKTCQPHEFTQQRRCLMAGIDHPAARIKNRLFCLRHQRNRRTDFLDIALHARTIRLVLVILRALVVSECELHILRNIDNHRPRTAIRRDIERLVQNPRQIFHRPHKIIMLRAVARYAHRIAFLKRIRPDQMRRHLPGNANERDGIKHRIGQPGHRIGRSRTRCHKHTANLAGRPRIPFRRMHRTLLMPHQNVLHLVLLEHRVINWQNSPARIAENMLDTLILQNLKHHLRAAHLLCHRPSPASLRVSVWCRCL